MLKFLALFSSGALLVLFWVTLESLFIKRLTWSYLFRFSLPATLVILIGMIGLLMLYVWVRLRRFEGGDPDTQEAKPGSEDWICRSLLRLPSELFWGTVVYGGLFIPIYHIVHFLVEGNSLVQVEQLYWLNFIRSFLYEQTIALSAAILHYTVARRIIRPMLISLSRVKGEQWSDKSFLSMLATTFAGLLLVNLFSILWYVIVAIVKNISIEFGVLVLLILLDSVFAVVIFILLALEFRRELQVLIGSIRDWLNGDRSSLDSRMPILSHDEVGQLAIAFNRLQSRMNREHEDLRRELQLARKVQLQLLPSPHHVFGDYEVQAVSESLNAVGNGFYDVVPQEHNGFVAIAGGITGSGMPAALQMSAALLLLRAEMEQNRAPEDILAGFRQGLKEVFPQEDLISLMLISVDMPGNVLRAVHQGHMNAHLIRDGRLEQLVPVDQLPFYPGDRLLLYSDPAAQAAEAIAREHVSQPESQMQLEERLEAWITLFKESSSSTDEDFTLLLITRREQEVRSE
ncbi:MAG: putative Phosphoserine phosphatase [Paenibacillus sp.]|jgi:hypothetical protein|nr:putative Phosphoserine phosphatase [Paenibacillus sp.]